MATQTTNYKLIKPDQTDTYNVDDFNKNMDTIDAQFKKIADAVYPVGSLYWSAISTDPDTLFGGTWIQIKDRFVLAAGDTYKAGTTDGEATHILSETELPTITPKGTIVNKPHSHGYTKNHIGWHGSDAPADNGSAIGNADIQSTTDETTVVSAFNGTAFGGGEAHNNMPPYIVMYCWQRTA